MKIITVGDIHGHDCWKKFLDLNILKDTPNLATEADLYIFVGDYCDSFYHTNVQILHNLKELIQLKKNYPDNVILLYGNHELHYALSKPSVRNEFLCSGHRPEAHWDLFTLFDENKESFQPVYQYENYIWTHAGIHEGWWKHQFIGDNDRQVAEQITEMFDKNKRNSNPIFDVGHLRGGNKNVGGIFWADKKLTQQKPLKGYHQIVGHTPVSDITTISTKDTSITYCDCLDIVEKYHELNL